jgi:hypothetical protein
MSNSSNFYKSLQSKQPNLKEAYGHLSLPTAEPELSTALGQLGDSILKNQSKITPDVETMIKGLQGILSDKDFKQFARKMELGTVSPTRSLYDFENSYKKHVALLANLTYAVKQKAKGKNPLNINFKEGLKEVYGESYSFKCNTGFSGEMSMHKDLLELKNEEGTFRIQSRRDIAKLKQFLNDNF